MKSSLMTIFSLILISSGVVSIVMVTGSLAGRAFSQDKPAAEAPPPEAWTPEAGDMVPTETPPAAAPTATQPPTTAAPTVVPTAPAAAPIPGVPSLVPAAPSVAGPEVLDPPMTREETEASIRVYKSPDGYSYDPTGRRDPFRQFSGTNVATPNPSNMGIPTSLLPDLNVDNLPALEQYEIKQFKLVGIIWEVNNPKATVKDPRGKVHLIRKDTKIGRNNGFVALIREGEVVVVEPTTNDLGMATAATVILSLPQ